MIERLEKRVIGLVTIVVVCLITMIGVGLAYQSTYSSDSNAIDYEYVTINPGGDNSALIAHHQEYNTYVMEGITYYVMPLGNGQSVKWLNNTGYPVVIDGSKDDRTYRLSLNTVNEGDDDETKLTALSWTDGLVSKRCYFVFTLTQIGVQSPLTYYGLDPDNDGVYTLYNALNEGNGDTVSAISEGSYTLKLYLQMYEASEKRADGSYGILVDKQAFVDKFTAVDMRINIILQPVV